MKLSNGYAKSLGPIYAAMSKAVLAAIAVSFADRINGGMSNDVASLVMDEWQALYDNGIVPQRPPAHLRYKFAGTAQTETTAQ